MRRLFLCYAASGVLYSPTSGACVALSHCSQQTIEFFNDAPSPVDKLVSVVAFVSFTVFACGQAFQAGDFIVQCFRLWTNQILSGIFSAYGAF